MSELIFNESIDLCLQGRGEAIAFDLAHDLDLEALRSEFNLAIEAVFDDDHAWAYHQLRLTERNTLIHTLFEDLCYLQIVEKYRDQITQVSTGRWFVFRVLQANGMATGVRDRALSSFTFSKRRLGAFVASIRFVLTQLSRLVMHRLTMPRLTKMPDTMIFSYASDSSIRSHPYRDAYFGELADHLEQQGLETSTCVFFHDVSHTTEALQTIASNRHRLSVVEDFLVFTDLFRILTLEWRKHRYPIRSFQIAGLQLDRYVSQWLCLEHAELSSSVHLAFKNLSNLQTVSRVYLQFENMVVEKTLMFAVRSYMRDAKCVGYFHTTKPTNLLCLEPTSVDPMPDKLVFNAEAYQKIYQDRYPEQQSALGYAFKQAPPSHTTTINCLLVLLTGITEESLELLGLLASAPKPDYPVFIRCHPMNPIAWHERFQNQGWQSDEAMQGAASRIIGGYSGALLEHALRGASVGLFARKTRLPLNPFDHTNVGHAVIKNAEHLTDFLQAMPQVQSHSSFFNRDQSDMSGFLI